jgi:hypothetical protein
VAVTWPGAFSLKPVSPLAGDGSLTQSQPRAKIIARKHRIQTITGAAALLLLVAFLLWWIVQYRIEDPIRYLFNVRDTLQTIREVNEARQDREKTINQAQEQANREIPKARGGAARTIAEAEGYALERVNRAQGEAARFLAVLDEYRRAPEVTRRRLYLEAMGAILGGSRQGAPAEEGGQSGPGDPGVRPTA